MRGKEGGPFSQIKDQYKKAKNWLTEVNDVLGEDPFATAASDGSLVLVQSDPPNRKIVARRFKNPDEMVSAREVTIFVPSKKSKYRHELWAPELHKLPDNTWGLYYAASLGDNRTHRTLGAKSESSDPMGPYEEIGRIYDPQHDHWGIDMTILHHDDGNDYAIWSGTANDEGRFPQNIYIAPMANPFELADERRMISTPEHAWEQSEKPINEGPQILKNKKTGQLFVPYSADASWSKAYNLGLLEFMGGDIMDPKNWYKHPEPVFDENGAGHASFIETDNENIIFYHEKEVLEDGWRDRMLKFRKFHFDKNTGLPEFQDPETIGKKSKEIPKTSHRILQPITSYFGPMSERTANYPGNGNGNGSSTPHRVA